MSAGDCPAEEGGGDVGTASVGYGLVAVGAGAAAIGEAEGSAAT